jgi:hypothetical protein
LWFVHVRVPAPGVRIPTRLLGNTGALIPGVISIDLIPRMLGFGTIRVGAITVGVRDLQVRW